MTLTPELAALLLVIVVGLGVVRSLARAAPPIPDGFTVRRWGPLSFDDLAPPDVLSAPVPPDLPHAPPGVRVAQVHPEDIIDLWPLLAECFDRERLRLRYGFERGSLVSAAAEGRASLWAVADANAEEQRFLGALAVGAVHGVVDVIAATDAFATRFAAFQHMALILETNRLQLPRVAAGLLPESVRQVWRLETCV
jgi:hypothetical protein